MVKVGLSWDEFRMVKVPDALENQPPPYDIDETADESTDRGPELRRSCVCAYTVRL